MPAVLVPLVPAAPMVIVGSTEVMVVALMTTRLALTAIPVTIMVAVAIAVPVMISVPAMVVPIMIADVFSPAMIAIMVFVVISRSRNRQHGSR